MVLDKEEVYKLVRLNIEAIKDNTNPKKQNEHKNKKRCVDRLITYFNEKFSLLDEVIENIENNKFTFKKQDLQLTHKNLEILLKKNIFYGRENGEKSSNYIIYIKHIFCFYVKEDKAIVHFDSRLGYKVQTACKSGFIFGDEQTKLYQLLKETIVKYINEKLPLLTTTFEHLLIVKNYVNSLIRGMSQKRKNEAFSNIINDYKFDIDRARNENKLKEMKDLLLMSMDISLKKNLNDKLK